MVKDDAEQIKKVLQALEKSKLVKRVVEYWYEQPKIHARTTIIIVSLVLLTILLLNLMGKLSMESNGWIIALLLGYLFGRGK
jgi:xanthine/uracil permease